MNQAVKSRKPKQKKTTAEENREIVLSNDPNKAIQEMMETIDCLRIVMQEETSALDDTDTNRFFSLQDRKVDAARDYESGMAQMLSRKDEIKAADPALKARLEEMRGNFASIAEANLHALDRMTNGTKKLGERIMRAARREAEREQQFAYGASGHLQNGGKATMGINESA